MTYGRSIFKALEMFRIDKTRWPELAANRSAWRETLRTGVAPPAFCSLYAQSTAEKKHKSATLEPARAPHARPNRR